MKKGLIVGGATVLLGLLIFGVSLAALGWDIRKLSTDPPFERKEWTVVNQNQAIRIEDQNMPFSIGRSPDAWIHFEYYENEKENYIIDEDGALSFIKQTNYRWYDFLFNIRLETPTFTILLPEGYCGHIQLETKNGAVKVKDIAAGDLSLLTSNGSFDLENLQVNRLSVSTKNGAIRAKQITADGASSLITSNGRITMDTIATAQLTASTNNNAVTLTSAEVSGDVWLTTRNGGIQVTDLSAKNDIRLTASNGSVTGNLIGGLRDFSITSKTSNGSNNLPENAGIGSQKLDVRTSNGSIRLLFSEG